MKIIILGASGFLGRAVERAVQSFDVVACGHSNSSGRDVTCDIRDEKSVRALMAQTQPDVVIHLAAYRSPDFCEENRWEAERLNVGAVGHVAAHIPKGCRYVYASTDYVFDGEAPPYTETDMRNPVNVYGETKCRAEDLVLEKAFSAVLRFPVLIGCGSDAAHSGFLYQLYKTVHDGTPFVADHVIVRHPTWIEDVAAALLFIIEQRIEGALHYSSEQGMTLYEALLKTGRLMGKGTSHIQPSDEVVPRPARRPLNSKLDVHKIKSLGFKQFTPFDDVWSKFNHR